MPTKHLDEHSLRERIARLTKIYEHVRRTLSPVIAHAPVSGREFPRVADLSPAVEDLNAAELMLKQIVAAWTDSPASTRRALAADIEQLKRSAAQCVELAASAEREYSLRRDGVSRQIDESATRNRAVRAYSDAMRR